MQEGKLTNEMLKEIIIDRIKNSSKEILVGPEIGEDCSIIDFGEDVCVLTTDPVTAAADNMGHIGVHICCNDIASAGVKPLGVMVTILAPINSNLEEIRKVMTEVTSACKELKVDILGGHTEVTSSVNRMVLSITAIGKGKKDKVVKTGGAKIGDDIILTGYAGLEGTAILAKEHYSYLVEKLGVECVEAGIGMLKNISVVETGMIAAEFGVNSMHDATEGGVLGGIWEVVEASNKGVYLYNKDIPIKEETIKISKCLGINPYRLISSGCMVITCKNGEELCNILNQRGIKAKVVGRITDNSKIINISGKEYEIAPPESDEIYNIKIEQ